MGYYYDDLMALPAQTPEEEEIFPAWQEEPPIAERLEKMEEEIRRELGAIEEREKELEDELCLLLQRPDGSDHANLKMPEKDQPDAGRPDVFKMELSYSETESVKPEQSVEEEEEYIKSEETLGKFKETSDKSQEISLESEQPLLKQGYLTREENVFMEGIMHSGTFRAGKKGSTAVKKDSVSLQNAPELLANSVPSDRCETSKCIQDDTIKLPDATVPRLSTQQIDVGGSANITFAEKLVLTLGKCDPIH